MHTWCELKLFIDVNYHLRLMMKSPWNDMANVSNLHLET